MSDTGHGVSVREGADMTGCELLTTAEMGEADRRAVEHGVPLLVLMENAGQAVADEAGRMVAPGARIAVLCGPGNNGGDGFVAARVLRARGFDVSLACLVPIDALGGDAGLMAQRWDGPTASVTRLDVAGAALVVDALFGAGLARPLEGAAADAVAAVNAAGVRVLAVDVPSGLDGTTGRAAGPVVAATRTVTFFRKKPGHVLMPGRELCREVVVADIGIPAAVLEAIAPKAAVNQAGCWLARFPWPTMAGHKYARGHAVVVSGPPERTGAARLGARAALRVGAGLVTVVGGPAATAVNATHATAIMVQRAEGARGLGAFLADTRRNAVLIGPGAGVGPDTAADVLAVLASKAAAVLDADALTSFAATEPPTQLGIGFVATGGLPAPDPETLFGAIKRRSAPVVLTPHDGEFERLFGILPGSKLDGARRSAELSGGVVVLKGPDTVIAHPDGRAAINDNAPPWLATAGSGDVLAGFVAGLLAQGMGAFEAACAAVWLHGACASRFGPGLIAEDLPEMLPQVLAGLLET